MTDIRINMVIAAEEYPGLHSILKERNPKSRATVLRYFAEFGIWAQQQTGGALSKIETGLNQSPLVSPVVVNKIAVPQRVHVSHSEPVEVMKEVTTPSLAVSNKAAPVPAQRIEITQEQNTTEQILDTSVLSGIDFGGLE